MVLPAINSASYRTRYRPR